MARIKNWSVQVEASRGICAGRGGHLAVGYVGITTSNQIVEADKELFDDKTVPLGRHRRCT